MSEVKTEAIREIEKLADGCTWDQVAYRMHVRAAVERGLADAEAGRVSPNEAVQAEVNRLLML